MEARGRSAPFLWSINTIIRIQGIQQFKTTGSEQGIHTGKVGDINGF